MKIVTALLAGLLLTGAGVGAMVNAEVCGTGGCWFSGDPAAVEAPEVVAAPACCPLSAFVSEAPSETVEATASSQAECGADLEESPPGCCPVRCEDGGACAPPSGAEGASE